MKRRHVLFWPGVLLGSLLVFIVGSFVLASKEIGVDKPPLATVYHSNPEKVLANSMPYELEDGVTKPIYEMSDAIIEELYVETEVDSDNDGALDKVFITVVRPPTEDGMKVPVLYWMTPYREHYSEYDEHFTVTGADGKTFVDNSQFWGSHYVSRGYGFVAGESLGTANSEGCPTIGGHEETLAAKAVVDWLNGRAKAFTADGEERVADWTTGDTAMMGASYDGTFANAVAATGVEGLKAIVPISAISSWYDYLGANGLYVTHGTEEDGKETYTNFAAGFSKKLWNGKSENCLKVIEEMDKQQGDGDYNDFWAARNYVQNVNQIKAAVLIAHGQNDPVVRPKNFDTWWEVLKTNDAPRKMWIGYTDHSWNHTPEWNLEVNRWLDHWLYGIENGIMDEPVVRIEDNDYIWSEWEDWPHINANPVTFQLTMEGKLLTGATENELLEGSQSFKDGEDMLKYYVASSPEDDQPNRLIYMTDELESDLLLSGAPILTLAASFDAPEANLSALLVDYGGIIPEVVTKGWIDPENWNSIETPEPIVAGEQYTLTWDMQPKAYTFKKGHRIGLVLIGTDRYYTENPTSEVTITVTPALSELALPLVKEEK
ncbi:CocE/NonD family hydrolase [Sporosarcina sp. 179-K 8C2 HS]|uniref:CocE/NonD family hydrolase n=1 Tax=Sporosarcina sp. 179-K 8C2 HS TaxID=3142387 RepID=UPI0039A3A879